MLRPKEVGRVGGDFLRCMLTWARGRTDGSGIVQNVRGMPGSDVRSAQEHISLGAYLRACRSSETEALCVILHSVP